MTNDIQTAIIINYYDDYDFGVYFCVINKLGAGGGPFMYFVMIEVEVEMKESLNPMPRL